MFGACAMGAKGGDQALQILKRQIQQVMEQVGCEKVEDFPKHLID
jgi:L-lactate dehydrogenase (cytochrome)